MASHTHYAQVDRLEAVRRYDAIFEAERSFNGLLPDLRLERRRRSVAPLVEDLERWMRAERCKMSRHSDVAKAMDYMLTRWPAFVRFLGDGRICLSNNAAERASERCAASRSAARHGCSPAPSAAVNVQRSCTR